MKRLKRITAALLVGVLLMSMAGCGKKLADSKYVGKWIGTTAEYEGLEMSVESLYGEFTVLLEASGKVTLNTAGEETTGKWEETDNGVLLDKEMELVDKDGKLVYETDGMSIYFERESK